MKYYPMFDLFDDFFTGNTTSDVMKTDIVEKDGNYEMSMELPGVKKEDIQMELKDGYLKVSATHGSNTEDKDEKVVLFVKNVLVDLIQEASMLVKVFIRKMSKLPLTMVN